MPNTVTRKDLVKILRDEQFLVGKFKARVDRKEILRRLRTISIYYRSISHEDRKYEETADAYRHIAETIEAANNGGDIPMMKLPKRVSVDELLRGFPKFGEDVKDTAADRHYVHAAALLLYAQYSR